MKTKSEIKIWINISSSYIAFLQYMKLNTDLAEAALHS